MSGKDRRATPGTAEDLRAAAREAREALADLQKMRRGLRQDADTFVAEIVRRIDHAAMRQLLDRANIAAGVLADEREQLLSDAWYCVTRIEQLHDRWLTENKAEFIDRLSTKMAREVANGVPEGKLPTGNYQFVDGPGGQILLAVEVREKRQQPRAAGPAEGNGQAVPPAFKRPDS